MTVTATCNNTAGPSVAVSGLPAGVTVTVQQPDCATAGKLTFAVKNVAQAPAAKYTATVNGNSSAASGSATASVDVVAQASVSNVVAPGKTAFMSTSFQLADWSWSWLKDHGTSVTPLNELGAEHIRIQLLASGSPQKSEANWDFRMMDGMVKPIQGVGDKSPQMQIGQAPWFMYDANYKLLDPSFAQYAEYCANLVRYYNTGGFTVNGTTYKSPSATPITWWGIHNEPNGNNVTADEYARMYNVVAQAMLAVDPNIKLVALELSDWGNAPQTYLPPLLATANQPIHAMATHYYGSCNQKDTDTQIFNTVATFVDHVKYFRTTMDANVATAGVPIWVTENNVNADWAKPDGTSACNAGVPWVEDKRGTSAYFAAWRPFVYSQLTKAGAAGLWHWSVPGGAQYGELTDSSTKYLSYWVDYHLAHMFGEEPMDLITTSVSEPGRIEMFGAVKSDGTRVIMVVNRDVAGAGDNNGTGVAKTVTIDLAGAGAFTTVELVSIDATTNLATGPTKQTLTPTGSKVTLTFTGYGVQFVTLK